MFNIIKLIKLIHFDCFLSVFCVCAAACCGQYYYDYYTINHLANSNYDYYLVSGSFPQFTTITALFIIHCIC